MCCECFPVIWSPASCKVACRQPKGCGWGIAIIMLVPILMVALTLIIPYPVIRWINIIAAIIIILFNLVGMPYKGAYDNFLIIVSFVFNGLTIWYAWRWASYA
jgi:hypothetical protein